jgi:hypothetical protein
MMKLLFCYLALGAQALYLPQSSHAKLHLPSSRGLSLPMAGGFSMSDPDTPPEVNPTRRDPDEPAPDIPIRLPVVDFGM